MDDRNPSRLKQRIVRLAVLAVLPWLPACVRDHRKALVENLPPERNIADIESRLEQATSRNPQLSLAALGDVRYGAFTAPLWHVTRPAQVINARRVFLSAGVHGGETSGVEMLMRFIEELAAQPNLYPGVAFDVFPLINPWGWAHNTRWNGDGRDINRDFASFKTQEAAFVRAFTKGAHYDLIVDHHEDSSATGIYVYKLANREMPLCRRVVAQEREAGFPIEQRVKMVCFKAKDGVIRIPRWSLSAAQFGHKLSMTNYLRITAGKSAFLVETPLRRSWEDRVVMHRLALDTLLAEIEGCPTRR